ncbi:hypothetical protein ACOJTA_06805 [Malaciobacter sp. WC5094]
MNKFIKSILVSVFLALFIAGCSVKDFNKVAEPEEKVFVYDRPAVSQELLKTVHEIINAMSQNNLQLLSTKFINQKFGVYNLYKVDGFEDFTYQKLFYNIVQGDIIKVEEFSDLVSRVPKKAVLLPIIQTDATFNCSPYNDAYYGWTNHGLFLNTNTFTKLEKLMEEKNMLKKDAFKKEDLHKAKMINLMSYKVILTPEIVFHLNKLDDGKWYITLIDRITTNCSVKKDSKNESTRILE